MNIQYKSAQKKPDHGFSLIELMIVLVIAGIIAAIAVPSYSRYIVRSKRAAAYSCLTQVSIVMEQIYADSFKFSVDLDGDGTKEHGNSTGSCAADGSNCESLDEIVGECADQISDNYTLSLGSINPKAFSLKATPVSPGFDDECGTLTLEHNGKASASGDLGDDCFSE